MMRGSIWREVYKDADEFDDVDVLEEDEGLVVVVVVVVAVVGHDEAEVGRVVELRFTKKGNKEPRSFGGRFLNAEDWM
jgi:hypothetical protein